MAKLRALLATCSFLGLIRYFRMHIMGRDLYITGNCLNCGACCRKINLEDSRGWIRSPDRFEQVCIDYPEYRRFKITGKDSQGFLQFRCTWLNTKGLCKDHDNRLGLCRKFPEKSLYFCGGVLPPNCGYSFHEIRPFRKFLDEELKK